MKRFEMKVPDEDHAVWKQKAEEAGVPLAEWVRERCNMEIVPVRVIDPEESGKQVAEGVEIAHRREQVVEKKAARKGKMPVFDGKPCRHGLLYCQRCIDIAEGKI